MVDLTETTMKARREAENDWENGRVFKLVAGTRYSNEPSIDTSGFYVASSGESREYVESYNSCVKELLIKHGTPEWAPSKREINESELSSLIIKSKDITKLDLLEKEDRNLVRWHSRLWEDQYGIKPESYIKLDEKGLIVLVGKIGHQKIKVYVIDLYYKTWMKSFIVDET